MRLPESQVDDLAGLSQVEYIEKPKRLYFEVNRAIRDTCIAPVQSGNQVSQNVYGRDADLSGRAPDCHHRLLESIISIGLSKRRWNDAHRRTLGSGAEPDLYAEELNRALEAGSGNALTRSSSRGM